MVGAALLKVSGVQGLTLACRTTVDAGSETATPGADFVVVNTVVTFLAGDREPRYIPVTLNRDPYPEASEWFSLAMESLGNATVPTNSSGVVVVRITPHDNPLLEMVMKIKMPAASVDTSALRGAVARILSDDTGPEDVVITHVDPSPDDPSVSVIRFEVHVGNVTETEVVRSQVQSAVDDGTLLSSMQSTGINTTTVDADLPELGFESAVVCASEGESAEVVITRSGGFKHPTTVRYWTVAGSASSGLDFVPMSGEVTFSANVNDTSSLVLVPVRRDGMMEGSEWFQVVMQVVGRGIVPHNTTGGSMDTVRVTIAPSDPETVEMSMIVGVSALSDNDKGSLQESIAAQLNDDIGPEDVVITHVDPSPDDPSVSVIRFEVHVGNVTETEVVRSQVQSAVDDGTLLSSMQSTGINTTTVDADLPELGFESAVVCASEGESAEVVITRSGGFKHPTTVRYWY